jgi:tetratricopeptide (TPR) repeat protein
MKRILIVFSALLFFLNSEAQTDIATMRDNARKLIMSGNMTNAIDILNKAHEADKDNIDVQKDLVLAYYYNKDYTNASEYVKQLLERSDVDEQSYQLAGDVYKAKQDLKEAEKMYKAALKKFPDSGPLYNEYGELLDGLKNSKAAIGAWEKGMQAEPSYSDNYYNAAVYYYKQPEDKIWAILYGEIYANMASLNPKSNEIKKMVLDAYKNKLFVVSDLAKETENVKNEFEKAVIVTFAKQFGIKAQGLNPETLAMIRTRFILDWNNTYAKKFPFKLFDYHQQLMRDGLFDSYNQWMFGPVNGQPAFENWVTTHQEDYDRFTQFHTSRIFKMPKGQIYSIK